MRFIPDRDYQTIVKINKELINDVVDTQVVIYKLHQEQTATNSYGEATKKVWYVGVQVPGLLRREHTKPIADFGTVNVEQEVEFAFLRQTLDDRSVYPEIGDIIDYANAYYEINNVNEVQLYAGRPEYNHSIVCSAHLTRKTNLQLEKPV